MKQRGIEVLKETQIRSWWSTYHQKRKNAASNLAEEVAALTNSRNITANVVPPSHEDIENQAQQTSRAANARDEDQRREETPSETPSPRDTCEPIRLQNTGVLNQSTQLGPNVLNSTNCPVNEQSDSGFVSACSSSQPIDSCLVGNYSINTPSVLEWQFSRELSQSTINGRSGSNACTFIALMFGHFYFSNNLKPPFLGVQLSSTWKDSLVEAILRGNEIHDDIFDNDGINVAVDDAIEIAGEECYVDKIEQQYDIFGVDCLEQLIALLTRLASNLQRSCHVVVCSEQSTLFLVNEDGSCMFVDSHLHGGSGALIAYAAPGQDGSMPLWFTRNHFQTLDTDIVTASVFTVSYLLD